MGAISRGVRAVGTRMARQTTVEAQRCAWGSGSATAIAATAKAPALSFALSLSIALSSITWPEASATHAHESMRRGGTGRELGADLGLVVIEMSKESGVPLTAHQLANL